MSDDVTRTNMSADDLSALLAVSVSLAESLEVVNDDVKLTLLRRFEIDPLQPTGAVTMPAFFLSFRR
jgi:hypothetical protein